MGARWPGSPSLAAARPFTLSAGDRAGTALLQYPVRLVGARSAGDRAGTALLQYPACLVGARWPRPPSLAAARPFTLSAGDRAGTALLQYPIRLVGARWPRPPSLAAARPFTLSAGDRAGTALLQYPACLVGARSAGDNARLVRESVFSAIASNPETLGKTWQLPSRPRPR
jgi:hypothetical protein